MGPCNWSFFFKMAAATFGAGKHATRSTPQSFEAHLTHACLYESDGNPGNLNTRALYTAGSQGDAPIPGVGFPCDRMSVEVELLSVFIFLGIG